MNMSVYVGCLQQWGLTQKSPPKCYAELAIDLSVNLSVMSAHPINSQF